MFGILNFLLIGLDFESYFIKLICILGHVLLRLGVHLMLHFVLKL